MSHSPRFLPPIPRSDAPELMDGSNLDPDELASNFRDIRRVNRLLGGTATTLRHIPGLLVDVPADRHLTVLDLATGSADIPLALVRWARRHNRQIEIAASDCSAEILAVARAHVAHEPGISLAQFDARSVPLPDNSFDIVLCSLSLHHFDEPDAIRVLAEMNRLARAGCILNDLTRGRLGYVATRAASRLTTRNRLTRHDGPLSILRAYTPDEVARMLRQAGITNARITTQRWFRMAAVWSIDTGA